MSEGMGCRFAMFSEIDSLDCGSQVTLRVVTDKPGGEELKGILLRNNYHGRIVVEEVSGVWTIVPRSNVLEHLVG